jgi:hypothetical protein
MIAYPNPPVPFDYRTICTLQAAVLYWDERNLSEAPGHPINRLLTNLVEALEAVNHAWKPMPEMSPEEEHAWNLMRTALAIAEATIPKERTRSVRQPLQTLEAVASAVGQFPPLDTEEVHKLQSTLAVWAHNARQAEKGGDE